MTFDDLPPDPPQGGLGSFGSGDDPDFDPEIAARFRLLDQLPAPETWPPRPEATRPGPWPVWPAWQPIGLAAAAVILLAVALTALLPDGDDAGSVVADSANGPRLADDEPSASDRPRGDGESDRSAFDGEDDNRPALVIEDRATTTRDRDGQTTSVPEDDRPDPTRPDDSKPKPTDTGPDPTRPSDTTFGTRPTVTLPPEPKPTGPTYTIIDPPRTLPTWTMPKETLPPETRPTTIDDGRGETVTIRGVVTEVFTDCQSRLVLNDDGEVVRVGPVSCDGGSHIVVDGIRIQTSSGFVPAEMYFDRHPRDLLPGTQVRVVAVRLSYGHSLDCDRCGVSIGR